VSLLGYLKILPAFAVCLLELTTGIARLIFGAALFIGRYAEVYLFIGLIYWVFFTGMSLASQRLERKLNIGQIKTAIKGNLYDDDAATHICNQDDNSAQQNR